MKDIYWIDQYEKKDPRNFDSYATCVIDGYGWRVDKNGKTYCAGKVENLTKKEEQEVTTMPVSMPTKSSRRGLIPKTGNRIPRKGKGVLE